MRHVGKCCAHGRKDRKDDVVFEGVRLCLLLRFLGKEYFDVFYGIEPLAWAFCGFCIVYYGAVLKNAAQKYNIPPAPQPPKVGGFVGKEVENEEPSYMDPSIKQGPY